MNEHEREPEFYASATLGFRQWHFGLRLPGHEIPPLQSMVRSAVDQAPYRWTLQGSNHASCSRQNYLKLPPDTFHQRHGEVPGAGCSCGFHAYGHRRGSGSETTLYVVGGVVAGWGNLELHELGFRCGVAKILALFEPDPANIRTGHAELAAIQSAALGELCAAHSIPLLEPDALMDEDELRRYAYERDLALLEDQLNPVQALWPALEAIGGEEELAS